MTSLIVQTADFQTGKPQQTTFTGVNPNAQSSKLKTFAQMTAALSKDSYVKAVRLDQADLDVAKTPRSISQLRFWKGSNSVYATENNGVFALSMARSVWGSTAAAPTVWLNSDSFAKLDCVPYITGDVAEDGYQCQPSNKRWTISFYPNQADASTIDVTFHFPENDTYNALDVTLTINITED